MDHRMFAIRQPHAHATTDRIPSLAGRGRVVRAPAFDALSVLARAQANLPLPRLDRVIADKARLMALAADRQAWRPAPLP